MRRDSVGKLLALMLLSATWSCSRLPERRLNVSRGPMTLEMLPDSVTVPSAWGNLVSVTINPVATHLFDLWFQDSRGDVRLVILDGRAQHLSREVVLISRR